MLPTFVIAGAQKCGTTSLAGALRQHEQIHMSRRKELHFFDRHFDKGMEWYEQHFTPKPKHLQVGEATPAYMYDEAARERMVASLPGVKVVVILRNPVDRAYSHYWHKRRLGHEQLETFEEAMAAEPERRASTTVRRRLGFAYVDRGHYVDQLQPLAEAVGRDRLHVLLLDDLVKDKTGSLAAILDFLGVDTAAAADLEVQKKNSYRVTSGEGGTVAVEYTPMTDETRRELTAVYADSNRRLEAFLGRDLSAWG